MGRSHLQRPPDSGSPPETRNPTSAGRHRGVRSHQENTTHTRYTDAVSTGKSKRDTGPSFLRVLQAGERRLGVYDGQRRVGGVIGPDRGEAEAFDEAGRFLGKFSSRQIAMSAIGARDAFEREGRP